MRRTKEDALVTKHHIIDTAVVMFIENGFSGTTLNEIAKRSNVTRGAIYWHFHDKLDILNELVETHHDQLRSLLDEQFGSEISSMDQISTIIEELVNNFFGSKSFRDFIELTWFKIEYTQLSNLSIHKREVTQDFIAKFSSALQQAKTKGLIRSDIEVQDIAVTITNMINGMYRFYFLVPDLGRSRTDALRLFNSYLKLIKA